MTTWTQAPTRTDRREHLRNHALYVEFYNRDAHPGWIPTMPPHEPRLIWVLEHIGPHDDVIDIGCHKGEMTREIRKVTDGAVHGVDISENAITQARLFEEQLKERHCYFSVQDAGSGDSFWRIYENMFDVAVVCEILEHVPDPTAVLREAERVVRPGGWIVLSVPVGAEYMDRQEAPTRDRELGFALDMHVREYFPEVVLAHKPGFEFRMGVQDPVPEGAQAMQQRLAAYRVER